MPYKDTRSKEKQLIFDGGDWGDQLISSCPLHCRHVRQAGFADNVKAIYFHAVSEESCVYWDF